MQSCSSLQAPSVLFHFPTWQDGESLGVKSHLPSFNKILNVYNFSCKFFPSWEFPQGRNMFFRDRISEQVNSNKSVSRVEVGEQNPIKIFQLFSRDQMKSNSHWSLRQSRRRSDSYGLVPYLLSPKQIHLLKWAPTRSGFFFFHFLQRSKFHVAQKTFIILSPQLHSISKKRIQEKVFPKQKQTLLCYSGHGNKI